MQNLIKLFVLTILVLGKPVAGYGQMEDVDDFIQFISRDKIELNDIFTRLDSLGIDSTKNYRLPEEGHIRMAFERQYNLPGYSQIVFTIVKNFGYNYMLEIIYKDEHWMSLAFSDNHDIILHRRSEIWEKMKADWDRKLGFESLQSNDFSQLSLPTLGQVGKGFGDSGTTHTFLVGDGFALFEDKHASTLSNWAASLCPEVRTVGIAGLLALQEIGYTLDVHDLKLIETGQKDDTLINIRRGCTQSGFLDYRVQDFIEPVADYFIFRSNTGR
ncbi:MAG: hypothetical protein AAGF87_12285 [Bacteroidota bacterium]